MYYNRKILLKSKKWLIAAMMFREVSILWDGDNGWFELNYIESVFFCAKTDYSCAKAELFLEA